MSPLAALTRGDVADYVYALVWVYVALIFIRVLMSWMPRIPYNRFLDMVLTFVRDVVDPYLNLFRRLIPPLGIGLDLSPMIATFVLIIVGNLVVRLIQG